MQIDKEVVVLSSNSKGRNTYHFTHPDDEIEPICEMELREPDGRNENRTVRKWEEVEREDIRRRTVQPCWHCLRHINDGLE